MPDMPTTRTTGRYGTAGGSGDDDDDPHLLLLQRGEVGVEGVEGERGGHGVGFTTYHPNVRSGVRYAMFGIVLVGCVMVALATHAYATYWTQADLQVRTNNFHDDTSA